MPARTPKDSASSPRLQPRHTQPRVAIVVSRYNGSVTAALEEGARRAYGERGGQASSLTLVEAPGAFELTALSLAVALTGRVAGVLALGCIIKGETSHDAFIAHAVAQGLTNVTIATGIPVALGVLTVDTPAQAQARAGGAHGNKGHEAMTALLDTIAALHAMGSVVGPAPASARPDKARRATGRNGRRNGRRKGRRTPK